MPTKRLSGRLHAMGMMFPPPAQPSSSTRHLSMSVGVMPKRAAMVARLFGWLAEKA